MGFRRVSVQAQRVTNQSRDAVAGDVIGLLCPPVEVSIGVYFGGSSEGIPAYCCCRCTEVRDGDFLSQKQWLWKFQLLSPTTQVSKLSRTL
jgi:hypothetical protein